MLKFLFLLLLFPLSLEVYCLIVRERRNTLVIFFGFLCALLTCLYKVFLTTAHRLIPYSVGRNFAYYFFTQAFLPVAVLTALFFLLVRDDAEFKLRSFFPLTASFYAVFLPYIILSTSPSVFTFFTLLVKPVLYLAMLAAVSRLLLSFYGFIKERKLLGAAITATAIAVCLVLPALAESFYAVHSGRAATGILCACYALAPLGFLFFRPQKGE